MIFSLNLPKIFAIFREPSICNFLTKVPHLIGNGKNREKPIVFRKQRPWHFVIDVIKRRPLYKWFMAGYLDEHTGLRARPHSLHGCPVGPLKASRRTGGGGGDAGWATFGCRHQGRRPEKKTTDKDRW